MAPKKLFLLGGGALGHAVLDSLAKYLELSLDGVVVIDKRVPEFVAADANTDHFSFKQVTLTPHNVNNVFDEVLGVSAGGVVLDLLINCDPVPLLEACMERDAHYLNAATDAWLDKAGIASLAREQDKLLEVQDKYNNRLGGAPTAFLEQGMNPGMVNSFVLKALEEAATASGVGWPRPEQFLSESGIFDKRAMLAARADVARRLGLTSIHSTDVDYHLSGSYRHAPKVLASTWGPTSFWEECVLAAEWHAGTVGVAEAASSSINGGKPATMSPAFDTSNGITARTPGRQAFSTRVKSYSGPEGYYNGMVVPHGENFSLGRNLTVWSTDADATPGHSAADSQSSLAYRGQAVWSPEVAFVYRPNNLMLESCFIHGCDGSARVETISPYVLHTKRDQLEGQETVGVLLRFDGEGGACKYHWSWCGNTLGYTSPDLSHPTHNATILQVAGGVLAAVQYMLTYPREGICWPEEAAHTEFILEKSLALLGRIDIMHGSEALAEMPRLLTSPGALVQLNLPAELERVVTAVRGASTLPATCLKQDQPPAEMSDTACQDQGA